MLSNQGKMVYCSKLNSKDDLTYIYIPEGYLRIQTGSVDRLSTNKDFHNYIRHLGSFLVHAATNTDVLQGPEKGHYTKKHCTLTKELINKQRGNGVKGYIFRYFQRKTSLTTFRR